MSDDIFRDSLSRYNSTRSLADKSFYSACYAPFVSLYLDQFGNALACCQNRHHVVGNVERASLREIWNGPAIRFLRDALRRNDLRRGCGFCESQFLMGNADGTFMGRFDEFPLMTEEPPFPQLLEFSVSNACNLECEMCNGDWSSVIRTRREKRPPLPKVYGDRFFDELREFLPHLHRAYFYGGEPFLQQESFRIWEMIIELGLQTPCLVTTNGTQWNARIERIVERLPFSFCVSIDGATKETFEKIRVRAKYDEVMDNVRRWRAYCDDRGTLLSFSHCLMVPNWQEFGDYLAFADEWRATVSVNTVYWPESMSLLALPTPELEHVVERLSAQDAENRARLSINRSVWMDELERLKNALASRRGTSAEGSLAIVDQRVEVPIMWAGRLNRHAQDNRPMTEENAEEILAAWAGGPHVGEMDLDQNLTITRADLRRWELSELREEQWIGRRFQEAGISLQQLFGSDTLQLKSEQNTGFVDDMTQFRNEHGTVTVVRAISIPRFNPAGDYVGLAVRLARRIESTGDV